MAELEVHGELLHAEKKGQRGEQRRQKKRGNGPRLEVRGADAREVHAVRRLGHVTWGREKERAERAPRGGEVGEWGQGWRKEGVGTREEGGSGGI